jgi:putative tricarboxylic transport membrane protein
MDALGYILNGFDVALTPMNLLYCLLGVTIGTTIGVLPGLGPVATMSILLPLTYNISPVSAIIMLSGIYYGAMYGGSTTTILMKLPGEAASVVTALDGYEMTKQGRAGFALCIAAVGSFLAATIAIVCLSFFAPIVAKYALKIGPPEYATLMVMSLSLVAYLSTTSFIKSLTMAGVGLLLACVGTDPEWGVPRLAFGSVSLMSGIDFAVIAMGLFGVGEILSGFESKEGGKLLTRKLPKSGPFKRTLTVKCLF